MFGDGGDVGHPRVRAVDVRTEAREPGVVSATTAKVLRAAALAAALAAGVGVARRHRRLVAPVAPDLRVPPLYVPMSIRSDASLRIARALMTRATPPVGDGVDVRTEQVPGVAGHPDVRVLVYERADRPRPSGVLVWLHGGGLVMGTAESANDLCGRFASELDIAVVSVDYRLAPEHPFPAGLDDCVAALDWVRTHADELGVDPSRVAVGGDSAGGGLAACAAQVAHDRGLPLRLQLLLYPMLDDRTAARRDHDGLVWSNASNRYSWTAYLGHAPGEPDDRPYAAAARRDDLSGLAPAWIGVGDVDLFHDEDVDYAARLRADSVPCELHVVPGMYHAADRMAPSAASMRDLHDRMLAALAAALVPERAHAPG
jgi:acetyl esterase/lipase